jgi:predicted RecB family endonuclease
MSAPRSTPPKSDNVDLKEVERLIGALADDLARVKRGGTDVEGLRAEVEALRRTLGSPTSEVSSDHLHAVHGRLSTVAGTLEADTFRAARYVAELGRLLGLG